MLRGRGKLSSKYFSSFNDLCTLTECVLSNFMKPWNCTFESMFSPVYEKDQSAASLLLSVGSGDNTESCRENAMFILCDCVEHLVEARPSHVSTECLSDLMKVVGSFVDHFQSRLSLVNESFDTMDCLYSRSSHFNEESEDIRYMFVQLAILLFNLLVHCSDHNDELEPNKLSGDMKLLPMSTLCRTISLLLFRDPNPEIKSECCDLIKLICEISPNSIRLNAETILRPLVFYDFSPTGEASPHNKLTLLNHRHSKLRVLSLESAFSILCCYMDNLGELTIEGGEGSSGFIDMVEKQILPSCEECIFDRVASVRKSLISNSGGFILKYSKRTELDSSNLGNCVNVTFLAKLLYILLMGLCDDVQDIRNESEQQLANLSQLLCDTQKFEMLFVLSFHALCPIIISTSTSWVTQRREKSLQSLARLMEYTLNQKLNEDQKKNVSEAVECVVPALVVACVEDDEGSLCEAAFQCANRLSLSDCVAMQSVAVLRLLLSNSSCNRISSILLVLNGIITGISSHLHENYGELLEEVSNLMSTDHVMNLFQQKDVMETLSTCSNSLVSALPDEFSVDGVDNLQMYDKIILNILRCQLQLLSCPIVFGVHLDTMESIKSLSRKSNLKSKNDGELDILSIHFGNMLKLLCDDDDVWTEECADLLAFDALVRYSSPDVTCRYLESIIQVMERHLSQGLNDDVSYKVQMKMLGFLQAFLSLCNSQKSLEKFSSNIVIDLLYPSLVWQAGSVSSGLRKMSLACLHCLLAKVSASDCLFDAAPKLFTSLRSNLDDCDDSTRHLACSCMSFLFRSLHGVLNGEVVRQIYPSLIKLLDDNNDNIRLVACTSISSLVVSVGKSNLEGTPIEVIIEEFLVHMDDPNPLIQKAVFAALSQITHHFPNQILKQTKKVRSSHRSNNFCDDLIKIAKNISD